MQTVNSSIGLKIPFATVSYVGNEETALENINNPISLFGRRYTPYGIIFIDNSGKSGFGGGCSLFMGYTYQTGLYGAQIQMSYSGFLRIRFERDGTWGEWTSLI